MTPNQEEALFDFLESITEPFTLEEITTFVHLADQKRDSKLVLELASLLDSRKIAFRLNDQQWLSRRGCFEPVVFVITPTRLELLNGILIPGHRCVPFANPLILPHEYKFFRKGSLVPVTTTEGPPEDFYPYYSIFGEEYAPQYIARDNPENESAFNSDSYEDPIEVSIHTLDMRNIYRELSFVPGDHFIVRTLDWKQGHFELEKMAKNEWSEIDLNNWVEAAESGFEDSFGFLGPGASTEEQIAYAYWYGGKRMREVPAYSLEEFLYEKTEYIETVPYGIETRFWYTGKEIPDCENLQGIFVPPDRTVVEDILFKLNIPISEFVVISYVRDAFFRNEKDFGNVIDRVIPPVIHLDETEWNFIIDFISDCFEDISSDYSLFLDQSIGPTRQRVAELHTAVIDLSIRLQKGDIESSWLPKHTFIVLSQIQGHAAGLLEDLAFDDTIPEQELETIENSLDSMIETYEDIKELIDEAMNNFRRNNLTLVRSGRDNFAEGTWKTIQISISGTNVWRRALLPCDSTMEDLHLLIQAGVDWKNTYRYRFTSESGDKQFFHEKMKISDVSSMGITELLYEYGTKWMVKVTFLSSFKPSKGEIVRYVAGSGAAPPETIGGPIRFRKILDALKSNEIERQTALHELGLDFAPDLFNMEKCNKNLNSIYSVEK